MITIDFETKSYADLKKVGAWAYSEHPTTDVICVCWGIDDELIQEWWPGILGQYTPPVLLHAIQNGHTVEAHHVAFERSIWMNVLVPKYGWLLPADDQWRDLMAVACYLSLPPALDKLSRVLGYGPKNKFHQQFITKYSKLHLKTAKTVIPEDDFVKIVAECVDDVRREQSIGDELGDLPQRELEVFQLDQKVNMRGIHLDRGGIAAATTVVDQREEELTKEFVKLTGLKPTQRDKIMVWCAREQPSDFLTGRQSVKLENLQAGYLEELLEDGNLSSGPVRQALDIRLRINKASTKKLDAMSRQSGTDGRARWQTRYHGAVTGRGTGSGFQPLNLSRGFEGMDPKQLARDIMHGDAAWLDMVYGDAMDAVAKAARYWIMAQEGSRLLVGDYSSIEAVILACLAGEQWKIDAFAAGEPIYERMAEIIHGLPVGTVTKKTHPLERQDGKTGELAGGYQGWLGGWLKFDNSGRHTDEEIKGFMRTWREKHPAIVAFWKALEEAAINAIRNRKRVQLCYSPIAFEMQDEWLTMILPNGKRLWYRDPQIRATMPPWHQPAEKMDCAAGTCDCELRPQVTYMAQKTGQWQRVHSYGGKWAENATQATSREILVAAMKRIAAKYDPPLLASGYLKPGESSIILSVYDEIVCELPYKDGYTEVVDGHIYGEGLDNDGSIEEFEEIMREVPDWAAGWPINVSAWQGVRYRK